MRILDAEQTRQCLPMGLAIESQAEAFSGEVEAPLRTQLAGSLFMPGRVGDNAGIKIVSTVPGNPAGMVMVLEGDGTPAGIVDGPTLTAIRTGAGCGLATKFLARGQPAVMAMLGAGAMAFDQVAAIREVCPLERVIVWSRDPAHASDLAARVGGEVSEEPDAAVAAADVVTTATPSTRPLFAPGSVGPSAHINAIGAFRPEMIEVPVEVTAQAFVVVDDRDAAEEEAGDIITAGRSPDADLREILAGADVPEDGVTFFKSVGIATQDVAAALFALRRAEEIGVGSVVR